MKPASSLFARWWRRAATVVRRTVRGPTPPAVHGPGVFAAFGRTRTGKLFAPAFADGTARPLIVMLHGCKQDPDDFARGTRMNVLAQQLGFLVLYPAQLPRSNAARCWNWFLPSDQHRGAGEPAAIVAMVREVCATHPVDERRIYAAGLSAGGSMAALLGREYPDVFAAVAVHSGLPAGAAHDVRSAFAVMKTGQSSKPGWPFVAAARAAADVAPTIVFQGDHDETVHPSNAQHVIDAVLANTLPLPAPVVMQGDSGGRTFTRTQYLAPGGRPLAELWELQGTGHAWSGGDPSGSYADAHGPDASREIVRFFEQQRARVTA